MTILKSLAMFLLCSAEALAYEVPEHYTPARPLGAGNAFVAVANDENAAWSNPAGLSRIRKARSKATFHGAKFPNLSVGANNSARNFYQDISSQADSVADIITNRSGELGDSEAMWVGTSVFPYSALEINSVPILFGLYNYTRGRIVIDTAMPESAEVEAISDLGAIITVALPSRSNLFSTGVTVRSLARYAYDDLIPSESLRKKSEMQTRFENFYNQTSAFAVDLGLIATFPDFWFPTFGLSILNVPMGCKDNFLNPFTKKRETVCGTLFTGDILNEDAMSIVDPTDVRAGFSVTPRISREISLRLSLDAHHLPLTSGSQTYGLTGIEAVKLLHGGAEVFFANPLSTSPLSFRAGVNQGFWTAGASIAGGIFSLEFATYGVDVSSSSKQIEDRRWISTVTLNF